jgi:hypothetical protein
MLQKCAFCYFGPNCAAACRPISPSSAALTARRCPRLAPTRPWLTHRPASLPWHNRSNPVEPFLPLPSPRDRSPPSPAIGAPQSHCLRVAAACLCRTIKTRVAWRVGPGFRWHGWPIGLPAQAKTDPKISRKSLLKSRYLPENSAKWIVGLRLTKNLIEDRTHRLRCRRCDRCGCALLLRRVGNRG